MNTLLLEIAVVSLGVLLLLGDTFVSRDPDPVLQQVEQFNNPGTTANDALKPVSRYWDRITHPGQLLSSLPHMLATLLDAAECGPVFLGLLLQPAKPIT